MTQKKIVLAITQDMSFYECFVNELQFMGFEVVLLLGFSERSLSKTQKKINSFLKFFSKSLKDKRLSNLVRKHEQKNLNRIKEIEKVDRALVIRVDLFSLDLLNAIRIKSNKFVAYQWDGIERYHNVKSKISVFDSFYVFDKRDANNNSHTTWSHNFYFKNLIEPLQKNKPIYDVYYLGSYDNRIDDILKLCSMLDGLGLKLNVKIPCSKKRAERLKDYSFIDTSKMKYSYLDNLKMASKARIILDFGHENLHQGLSFRSYEAIGFGLKCISTNPLINEINKYDSNQFLHYNPNCDLKEFVKSEIQSVPLIKYSFENWFNDLTQ